MKRLRVFVFALFTVCSICDVVRVTADSDVVGQVNAAIHAAWQQDGITPTAPINDAGFLRRASLDLTGTLPTPERARAFVADPSPDKRAKLLDELLSSEAYAERWADYWDAVLLGRLTREAFLDRRGFHDWLKSEFADNSHWDEIVTKLITADGYNTDRRPKGSTSDPADIATRNNPAVNWYLRYFQAIPELSGATAKIFLGVQIQCAQCHDHKSEKWTQNDFKQFTAFFTRTWPIYIDKALVVGTVRLELKDRLFPPPSEKYEQQFGSYRAYADATPKFLEGKELGRFKNRRHELAHWITANENPWFAKAFTNRLWATLLGRGFVEPIDDFRPSNPPVVPEALDSLAADFAASDFDVRRLLKTICLTDAYQRSCSSGEKPHETAKLWSAYPVKPLDVEPLLESILQSTGAVPLLDKMTKGNLELVRATWVRQFVTQMGTDDMAEVAEAEATITKMLSYLNGSLLNSTSRAVDGLALAAVLKAHQSEAERLDELYWRTVSRPPTDAERKAWTEFLSEPRKLVATSSPLASLFAGRGAGNSGTMMSRAGDDADFRTLANQARTAADFRELATKLRNNADAAIYARAFEEWVAEEPFRYLTSVTGAKSMQDQAWEDVMWSLLNSTEFLTNH